MKIGKSDHLETMIGSLNKLILDAKNKGIIRNKELSLLNITYKLLNNKCYYTLSESDKNKLLSLYYKLLNKYSFLCKSELTLNSNTYIKNNTNTTFINTSQNIAPTITNPPPYQQPTGLPAKLCEITKQISVSNRSMYTFTKSDLTNCFQDPNNYATGGIKNIKILSLPLSNPLTYNGLNVTVGQVIDSTLIDNYLVNPFRYVTAIGESNITDSFTYKVSTTSYPNLYSEETITMFIQVN